MLTLIPDQTEGQRKQRAYEAKRREWIQKIKPLTIEQIEALSREAENPEGQ